jgi:hypothetical protein
MKFFLFLFLTLCTTLNLYAQVGSTANSSNDKTITLTVIGQGKNTNDARVMALRNPIEQASGAFISVRTEIGNDNITKDKIHTIRNGNDQNYEIVNQRLLPMTSSQKI